MSMGYRTSHAQSPSIGIHNHQIKGCDYSNLINPSKHSHLLNVCLLCRLKSRLQFFANSIRGKHLSGVYLSKKGNFEHKVIFTLLKIMFIKLTNEKYTKK